MNTMKILFILIIFPFLEAQLFAKQKQKMILSNTILTSNSFKRLKGIKSCTGYPYRIGIELKKRRNSFKLYSTATESVWVDDIDVALSSIDFAEIKAKANLTEFLELSHNLSNQVLDRRKLPINVNGRSIVNANQLRKRVGKDFHSSASLKGVKLLSTCYQKGQLVKVTVEMSTETIKAAESLKELINKK